MKDPASLWDVRIDTTEWTTDQQLTATEASKRVISRMETAWKAAGREAITESVHVLIDVRLSTDTIPQWVDVTSLGSNILEALFTVGVVQQRHRIRSQSTTTLVGAACDVVVIAIRPCEWRTRSRAMTSSDAVHGDLHFTGWERDATDTLVVQRLRGIKQLGLADYVFHTATHTRFDHSLGTCIMAKRMLSSMEDRGVYRFAPGEKSVISMAALLHDISHIPFGHTLEDEHPVFQNEERHDQANRLREFLSDEALSRVLGAYGGEEVSSILLADESKPWDHHSPYQVQIVRNTVCADLLDYLRRDSWYCGLSQDYDDRLFDAFEIVPYRPAEAAGVKPHLALRMGYRGQAFSDIVAEALNLLRMRLFLADRVYYNPKKIAYGAMLAKAVRTARIAPAEVYRLQDHELLNSLRSDPSFPEETRLLTEAIVPSKRYARAYALEPRSFSPVRHKQREEFLSRHRDQPNARQRDENQIVEALGRRGVHDIRQADVVIYSPSTDMSLKEALVLGISPSEEVTTVHDMAFPEVIHLYDRYHDIWRFCLFVNKSKFADAGRIEILHAVCRDCFDGLQTTGDIELRA